MTFIRLVKFFVVAAVSLFLVMSALSFLFPSRGRVARNINVAVPREKVLTAISDLRVWEEWNAFLHAEGPNGKTWSSPSRGQGAWCASGQYRIGETAADTDGIGLDWRLKGGKEYTGGIQLLRLNPDSITVEWWFDVQTRWYPWERLGVFVYDRRLGPAMEESLEGLRRYLEKSN
jgi:hypothetical protein